MTTRMVTVVALMALALLSACQGTAYRMGNVEFDHEKYTVVGQGEQRATGIMLFSVIPIQNTNKVKRAVDRIIETHRGDELVNITVQESYFWAVILTGFRVDVSGTVLKKQK